PALLVQALAVGQLTARARDAFHPRGAHRDHIEHDVAIGQQQRVAGTHILDEVLVGAAHFALVARRGIKRDVERERLAFDQVDLALLETLDADLGPGKIGEDADWPAYPAGGLADLD